MEHRSVLHRVLSVPKMRFSAHDQVLREFTVTAPDGIRVLAPGESGSEMLASFAREQNSESENPPRRDPARGRRGRTQGSSATPSRPGGDDPTLGTTEPSPEDS